MVNEMQLLESAFFLVKIIKKCFKKIISSHQVTNNIAEFVAMIEILRFVYEKNKKYENVHYNIVSDSMYTIQCITKWIKKWKTKRMENKFWCSSKKQSTNYKNI